MKKAGWIIVTGIGIGVVSACSGGASNPVDACYSAVQAVCAKIYSCIDAQTIQNTFGYTSQSDCVTKGDATQNCANKTCPQGRTFNANEASICINDINTEACNQLANVPPSCTQTCQ